MHVLKKKRKQVKLLESFSILHGIGKILVFRKHGCVISWWNQGSKKLTEKIVFPKELGLLRQW